MKNKGFLLLEFIGYIFIFSLISLHIVQFIFYTQTQLTTQANRVNNVLKFYNAIDNIEKILSFANFKIKSWKSKEGNSVIWNDGKIDKGIYLKENKLFKVEGLFDLKTQKWKNQIKSLLVDQVNNINFDLIFKNFGVVYVIYEVSVKISDNKTITLKNKVLLKNRVIVV